MSASYDWQADALEWRLNAMSAKKRIAELEAELRVARAALGMQPDDTRTLAEAIESIAPSIKRLGEVLRNRERRAG